MKKFVPGLLLFGLTFTLHSSAHAEFKVVGSLPLFANASEPLTAFVDKKGAFGYVSVQSTDGQLVQVSMDTLARHKLISLPNATSRISASLYHAQTNKAYLLTKEQLIKTEPPVFVQESVLALPGFGLNNNVVSALDEKNQVGYFGDSSGSLVKVDLQTMTILNQTDLGLGLSLRTLSVDPDNNRGFVGVSGSTMSFLQIDLETLAIHNSIVSSNTPTTSFIDVKKDLLYIGWNSGTLEKRKASDLSLVSSLQLDDKRALFAAHINSQGTEGVVSAHQTYLYTRTFKIDLDIFQVLSVHEHNVSRVPVVSFISDHDNTATFVFNDNAISQYASTVIQNFTMDHFSLQKNLSFRDESSFKSFQAVSSKNKGFLMVADGADLLISIDLETLTREKTVLLPTDLTNDQLFTDPKNMSLFAVGPDYGATPFTYHVIEFDLNKLTIKRLARMSVGRNGFVSRVVPGEQDSTVYFGFSSGKWVQFNVNSMKQESGLLSEIPVDVSPIASPGVYDSELGIAYQPEGQLLISQSRLEDPNNKNELLLDDHSGILSRVQGMDLDQDRDVLYAIGQTDPRRPSVLYKVSVKNPVFEGQTSANVTVEAGNPRLVRVGETILLEGRLSSTGTPDSNLNPVIQWTTPAFPSYYSIQNDTTLQPTVTFQKAGSYDFTLEVKAGNRVFKDKVRIDVQEGPSGGTRDSSLPQSNHVVTPTSAAELFYSLDHNADVRIHIRHARTNELLISRPVSLRSRGVQSEKWNGDGAKPGVYLMEIEADGAIIQRKKIVVIR